MLHCPLLPNPKTRHLDPINALLPGGGLPDFAPRKSPCCATFFIQTGLGSSVGTGLAIYLFSCFLLNTSRQDRSNIKTRKLGKLNMQHFINEGIPSERSLNRIVGRQYVHWFVGPDSGTKSTQSTALQARTTNDAFPNEYGRRLSSARVNTWCLAVGDLGLSESPSGLGSTQDWTQHT